MYFLRILHEVKNLVIQGSVVKFKCVKHLIFVRNGGIAFSRFDALSSQGKIFAPAKSAFPPSVVVRCLYKALFFANKDFLIIEK